MHSDRADEEEGSQRALSDSPRDAVIEDEPPQSLPEEAAQEESKRLDVN